MEIDKNVRPTKKIPQEFFFASVHVGILQSVRGSRISWLLGPGGFFPSQSKGSKTAVILYPQTRNNTKQYLCAHLHTVCTPTQNTNNKHVASHKSTWGESSAFTGTCVNTGCTQVFQLHPLPSLQLARIEVHLWGVHAPPVCCCETGHAVTGIQPVSQLLAPRPSSPSDVVLLQWLILTPIVPLMG